MSIDAFSAVLHHSKAVGTDKVVLLGIAWHMAQDPAEGCWPSISTLARYANVSTRTVTRSLRSLQELGELEVHVNGGEAYFGNLRPNVYHLVISCDSDCQGYLKHSKSYPQGGHVRPIGVTQMSSLG